MKKVLLSFCVAISALCASAQSAGDMAAGLNLGVAPSLESGKSVTNFGLGAKFQYNVTDPIRLEADLDYWFKAKGVDVFDITVNAHYLFHFGEKLSVYPLIGIGYAHLGAGSAKGGYDSGYNDNDNDWSAWAAAASGYPGAMPTAPESKSSSASKFVLNVGVGAGYSLTEKISVGAEIKYQYIKDFSRLPISVGVTYKF